MDKPVKLNYNLLYVDGLRAIAAIYVMLHHSVLQYYDNNLYNLNGIRRYLIVTFFQGRLAVDLFIVISGFCLMLPVINANYFLKGGELFFLKKRIIRILPSYYLAMILSILSIFLFVGKKTGNLWDISIPVSRKDVINHILLIHDLFQNNVYKINYCLWSISVEFRIYLLFPIIVYLWRKIGSIKTLLIGIIISYLIYLSMYFLKQNFYPNINLSTPGVNPYIILFILGMIAAEMSFSLKLNNIMKRNFTCEILLIASVILYFIVKKVVINFNVNTESFLYETMDIAFGVCCSLLLIICSISNNKKNVSQKIFKALSWRPLVFLGSFAYSIYLIHAPIIQILKQYFINSLHLSNYYSLTVLIIMDIIVILPLSYLFFLLCEKPFMKLNKKISIKQTKIAAVIDPAP